MAGFRRGGVTSLAIAALALAVPASGAVPAVALSLDLIFAGHACALSSDGRVACWGHNNSGQLGQGNATSSSAPAPVLGIPAPIRSIAAGTSHVCAITTGGAVWCWGGNDWGQLGNGLTAD